MDAARGRFVVMGVSGSGKTVTGTTLAARLGARFVEGDDLHPPSNRAKMAGGTPLDDEDRWPWLDRVGAALGEGDPPVVGACSALRRAYRDRLRERAPDLVFLLLSGSRDLLEARLDAREGHFMPPALLDSQLATLEPLARDERGLTVDPEGPPEAVVATILDGLARL